MAKKADNIVPSADVKKLAEQKREATELVDFLRSAPCDTPESEQWFSSTLSSVRGLVKALEDQRTAITKPILASKRAVDELFSPVTKPLQECETVIRGKLADAARGRFEAEAATRRLAAEAAAQGDHLAVLDALASAPDAVATSGSSARAIWRPVVRDFDALPSGYKVVDPRFLATSYATEPAPVPGVEWVLDAAVRAK